MSGPTIDRVDRLRAGVVLTIALVAACSSRATTALPAASLPGATPTAPAVAPSLDIEQPGLTPATGQTDTDWGPIWNDLPPGFPLPPGGEPLESGAEPATAAWTIAAGAAADPLAIAQRYVDAFSIAGYGGGRDGPLEDGSYTAWASSGYGCDMLVTATPRGEDTLVTALYGAGCPFSWPQP
jgi:hypothetical protein